VDGQGDAAFEEFVRCRQAALFRTAFLLSGDRGHAEDLLQGALERAYQHWRRVADAGNPGAYVRRIMVNLADDRWRARRHVVEQGQSAAGETSAGVTRPAMARRSPPGSNTRWPGSNCPVASRNSAVTSARRP